MGTGVLGREKGVVGPWDGEGGRGDTRFWGSGTRDAGGTTEVWVTGGGLWGSESCTRPSLWKFGTTRGGPYGGRAGRQV